MARFPINMFRVLAVSGVTSTRFDIKIRNKLKPPSNVIAGRPKAAPLFFFFFLFFFFGVVLDVVFRYLSLF